ncbi:MAG: YicC family protein [Clostridia bacterium]|nr:YicC family protein [Clostridia bacterium]
MYSMTGYGKGIAERSERKITVEIKTVNHRFSDFTFKMPRNFQFAEGALRTLLSSKIKRGHADIYLTYEDNRLNASVALNEGLAIEYKAIAKKLEEIGYTDDLTAQAVIRIPDMVKTTALEEDEALLLELVKEAATEALDNLLAMRKAEGTRLVEDVKKKLDDIEVAVETIAKRAPEVGAEYREKLTERVKEALDATEIDEGRIALEVAVFIDRANVDEEITRLRGHLAHYRDIFNEGGAVGKKLDFLTQEANRETNTIGSKCNDMQITKLVLFLKNQIEMIREQIQNLE